MNLQTTGEEANYARYLSAAEKLQPVVRDVVKDDWAFILASWKKSARESDPWVPSYRYFDFAEAEISTYRNRGARFRVASDPEDSNFIWGWACSEAGVLHYVYVRTSSREQGVAGQLVADAGLKQPVTCTHWTEWATKIAHKRPGALVFAPDRKKK